MAAVLQFLGTTPYSWGGAGIGGLQPEYRDLIASPTTAAQVPALLIRRARGFTEPLLGRRARFLMTSHSREGEWLAHGWNDGLRIVSEPLPHVQGIRSLQPAQGHPDPIGRRAVLAAASVETGLRAVGPVRITDRGELALTVIAERDWYGWSARRQSVGQASDRKQPFFCLKLGLQQRTQPPDAGSTP